MFCSTCGSEKLAEVLNSGGGTVCLDCDHFERPLSDLSDRLTEVFFRRDGGWREMVRKADRRVLDRNWIG